MNLFDFDFSNDRGDMFSDETVSQKFAELKRLFKDHRNPHFMSYGKIPSHILLYIDHFEKKGWVVRYKHGINILDPYLDYHTVDEVKSQFKHQLEQVLNQPDVNWYKNILPIINHEVMPYRVINEEMKKKMLELREQVAIEAAKRLGLKHFLEVPSARGYRTKPFTSDWARKHLLPIIIEAVKPINDYWKMKEFFTNHVFFFGRRDWDNGYREGYKVPPYPEFKRLLPSIFELVCLCETSDENHIKLILEYVGIEHLGLRKIKDIEKEYKIIYPKGWSMERYLASLTDEDKRLIKEDQERLRKLHNPEYFREVVDVESGS